MKITPKTPLPFHNSPDLPLKPPRRKTPLFPRKSGPPTPLLRWNFHDKSDNASPETRRKQRTEKGPSPVSSRKLAASLWRQQGFKRDHRDPLGFKVSSNLLFDTQDLYFSKPQVGQVGDRLPCHDASRDCGSKAKDALRSPCSVNGPTNGFLCKRPSPFQFSNYAMEGVTKWDPVCSKASNETSSNLKEPDNKANAASTISLLQIQLEEAQACIQELESERRSLKKKLEHFLKKLSDERAAWRSREHEKVRAIIDDVKADLTRERKNRHRLEIVNAKLVNELAEAKLSARRYIQDYEKERKSRHLIEKVCDELAKEIGEDKAEVDTLKRECLKIRDEIEDERKMLQMAEVWREERVQMKLIDAKVTLDQKYSQMNQLIFMMEDFLRLKGATLDVNEIREAKMLQQAAASMSIQDIKEFTYEPSNPDDIFAVVEEMAMAETHEKEIEPCVEYTSVNQSKNSIQRLSQVYVNQNGDVDDDVSGWETVSNADDQVSSYSAEGSIMSVSKMCRDSNFSGSCTEWEEHAGGETPTTETSDVCSVQSKPVKKVKSITRIWRSCPNNGDNYKLISVDGINGRVSFNGVVVSPDCGSGKGGIGPSDIEGWSSPDSGKARMSKGMTGCIEWPRGASNINLKHKVLDARMQTQKIQLKHVLKRRI